MSPYYGDSSIDREARRYKEAFETLKSNAEDIDTYNQRILKSFDIELKEIMATYRDGKIKDFVVILEWLRRNMPELDKELRTYLFTDKNILDIENNNYENSDTDIGIGSLK